jgi:hypothetical protein
VRALPGQFGGAEVTVSSYASESLIGRAEPCWAMAGLPPLPFHQNQVVHGTRSSQNGSNERVGPYARILVSCVAEDRYDDAVRLTETAVVELDQGGDKP